MMTNKGNIKNGFIIDVLTVFFLLDYNAEE